MILSYDNEGNEEKDFSNESIEISKIDKIEVLLTKQSNISLAYCCLLEENKKQNDNVKSLNVSIPLSNNEKDSGENSRSLSSKDTPLSREEQCFQTDVWQEIEKCVKQREEKQSIEDIIINVSNESSSSGHHSKNFILKSQLNGGNIQPEPIESKASQMNISFLSNTNNIPQNFQEKPYDNKPYPKIIPFPIINQDDTLIFPSKLQMGQNFSSSTTEVTHPTFNNNNFNNPKQKFNYDALTFDEIIKQSPILCKEQVGCRFLQKSIDEYPKIAKEMYKNIKDLVVDLSCDSFGNYFIQKVIENLSVIELDDLIRGDLATYFKHICLNPHGTRVIQKYLEKIYMHDTLLNIFNILLKPNILEFSKSQNANHIIIKYITLVQSSFKDFIIHSLNVNLVEIATSKHSCRTLQKTIEYSNQQQKIFLLTAIAKNSSVLFINQFGNYVIQFALKFGEKEVNKIIVNNYLQEFPKYSSHKFASNVFEKCLEYSDKETKNYIIERLCNSSIVENLLFDTYGNYVLQKTMIFAKEPFKTKFFEMILPLLKKLQLSQFGNKIYQKFITIFPELAQFNNFQQNICYPINNYGNICYQNNHIYNPIYLPSTNINNPVYEKLQGFTPQPPFRYVGKNM